MLSRRHFLHTLTLLAVPRALRAAPVADVRIVVERGAWGEAALVIFKLDRKSASLDL